MVGITLAVADARLTEYLTAERRVLDNQAYEIEGRKLTRADLQQIREGIVFWQGQVDRLDPKPVKRAIGRVRRGSYRNR
ncbi:DUF6148 family protein [uncultured Sphingomonas sp.]|uniref:DUF6148 family protein n=1 Tax=uncultured Sphingomonas sp. TaxID=158754 RepID=UPI0025D9D3CF|nr:DUF6148 family protein [uncultured Sphingomonas sp.]